MMYLADRATMYEELFASDAGIAPHFCAGKMLKIGKKSFKIMKSSKAVLAKIEKLRSNNVQNCKYACKF